MNANSKKKYIKVQQIRSTAKKLPVHKACIRGLGLRRIGHIVELEDTPAVRGMINKVSYLCKILEA